MLAIWSIIKKELRSYFNSPAAYIFIVVFLVVSSWLYVRSLFLINQADMKSFFTLIPWIFLIMVPAVSMKMWAEERKLGSIEVLLTLPIKDWHIVVGKFFASLLFVIIAIAGTAVLPILLQNIAEQSIGIDVGAIIGSYIGTVLLVAAFLAIGLWASSITDNQIVAFILSVVVIFVLMIIGAPDVLFLLPESIRFFVQNISLTHHYDSIIRGVIDSRDILYYVSVVIFFMTLNLQTIKQRNWR